MATMTDSEILDSIERLAAENLPFHINLLSVVAHDEKLKETLHSRILGNLLSNNNLCKSFVREFVNEEVAVDEYKVEIEAGRVDISLHGKKYFIIIENKINDAPEQEGQICRYVEFAESKGFKPSNIYVAYLNKDNRREPSNGSKTYTDSNGHFHKMPKDATIIPLSYSADIYKWLKKCLHIAGSKVDEMFLKPALTQYIDYLKSDLKIYEPMTKEKAEALENLLNLKGDDIEKYNRCESILNDVKALQNRILELQQDQAMNIKNSWEKELQKIFEGNTVMPYKTIYDRGYKAFFPYKGTELCLDVAISSYTEASAIPKWKPWWGFEAEYLSNSQLKADIANLLGHSFELGNPSEKWPIWKYAAYDKIIQEVEEVKRILCFKEMQCL